MSKALDLTMGRVEKLRGGEVVRVWVFGDDEQYCGVAVIIRTKNGSVYEVGHDTAANCGYIKYLRRDK